jgi:hypothetical protein
VSAQICPFANPGRDSALDLFADDLLGKAQFV